MKPFPQTLVQTVRSLRQQGKAYGEIQTILGQHFPKSTLSYWCKDIVLPEAYSKRIALLNFSNLGKARTIAIEINKIKREEYFERIKKANGPIAEEIKKNDVAKIALAMLCLGEASKSSRKSSSFYLGNSDPKIIVLFLGLLKQCYTFSIEKVRCTVQCRADQDANKLKTYWMNVTNVPEKFFYKPLIDPRTIGKMTKNKEYKGVLRVDYFDNSIQHELESLCELVYNDVHTRARGAIG